MSRGALAAVWTFGLLACLCMAGRAEAQSPQIAGTSPTLGGVGASVWISGSNFGSAQGSSTVTFNGVTATTSSWSATGISAVVPSGATTGNIVVTVSGVASNGTQFTVVTTPQIAGTSPTQGGVGASVWISGSNFGSTQGSSTVSFNGVAATPASWSNTGLSAPVPAGATTGNIVVTVGGVASNGSEFSVVATPQIAGTSPTLGGVGASVWISGSNFGSAQGSSTVTFNGVTATTSSWSATGISAVVPSGATTGNIVVTVSGVASNGTEFNVVTTPQIAGMSPTLGGVGTNVWISGSNFGSTQGSSTVSFNGVAATPASWSNTGLSVPVPSGATTGNIVVTVGGVASNGATFTVNGPVIAGLSSQLGAVGDSVTVYGTNFGAAQGGSTVTFNGVAAAATDWNSMTIVVPVPTGATTGPITVTVSGASSSSSTFTVGSPDTITGVSITSPSDGAVVSTPYAAVTGTVAGSIAGIDPIVVTCNDAPATLTSANFTCNPPLSAGVNSITVTGTDSAGDTQTATISVTLSMQGPISLQVTPPNANMLVGGTQSFTAVDDQEVRRPDATWTVSDSTIASFVNGSPNTLMANAVGQVTLTATVGGVSAQTTVTVLSGTSLPSGTVLWSAPPVAGFTTQQIVQAVPTANAPDLYAIDTDGNGDFVVQALKADGEQLWQNALTNGPFFLPTALGDNNGGLLIETLPYPTGGENLTDFDAQTGSQSWQYTVPGSSNSLSQDVAVGFDGTVYVVETNYAAGQGYIDELSPSGTLLSKILLPTSSFTQVAPECSFGNFTDTYPGLSGPLVVAADGSVYAEVESYQQTDFVPVYCNQDQVTGYNETLSLLRIVPGGGTQTQTLASYSLSDWYDPTDYMNNPPYHSPGDVIPDGQGGELAAWMDIQNPLLSTYPITVADVGQQGIAQANFSSLNAIEYSANDNSLVLGDNNTAFATDGNNVVAFDATSLQQKWSYSGTPGAISFVAATSGGGVTINDSSQGVIQLDSSGNASAPVPSLQGATPLEREAPLSGVLGPSLGLWTSDNNTPVSLALLVGGAEPLARVAYVGPDGDQAKTRSATEVPAQIALTKLGSKVLFNGDEPVLDGFKFPGGLVWGWGRLVTYTIEDAQGNPIKQKGMSANERIQLVNSNPPQQTTFFQPVEQPATNKGVFHDGLIFGTHASPAPVAGDFAKDKQWINVFTKAAAYPNLRINCLDLEYNDGTITDVTNNPNATCQ
jgi:Glucodextranase, domain B/IPT/TIG domain